VTDFEHIPEEMESYTLKGGLYSVITQKGSSFDFSEHFNQFSTFVYQMLIIRLTRENILNF